MSLKWLSKDKEQRFQQLCLILHNQKIYGIKWKQELLDEYNKLKKELSKK